MSKEEKLIVNRTFGAKNLEDIVKKIIKNNLNKSELVITNKLRGDS